MHAVDFAAVSAIHGRIVAARNRGAAVLLLIEDATESYFPEFKAGAIAMIRAQGGIVGWTAQSAGLLAALA